MKYSDYIFKHGTLHVYQGNLASALTFNVTKVAKVLDMMVVNEFLGVL